MWCTNYTPETIITTSGTWLWDQKSAFFPPRFLQRTSTVKRTRDLLKTTAAEQWYSKPMSVIRTSHTAQPFFLWGPVQLFSPSHSWRQRAPKLILTPKDETCLAAAAAKSLQSCPTLCDPMDSSPPGSPVPGILQARTLEWVAISFSNAWKRKVKVKSLSRVRLLATPWTAAFQAPPSMGFSRQEYWSGVPLPSPETCLSRPQPSPLRSASLHGKSGEQDKAG